MLQGALRGGWLLLFAIAISAVAGSCSGDSNDVAENGGSGNAGGNGASSGFGAFDGSIGDSGQNSITKLVFDPPSAKLVVDGTTPQTASFTLRATRFDGQVLTVQAQSVEFDRPDIATLSPGPPAALTAIGDYAGTGKLRGIYEGLEAVATLEVEVMRRDVGPGVDGAIATALDAPGLAADPQLASLLYPYDLTVFPLGLSSPLVMWSAPKDGDVYRLRYAQAGYTFDTYRVVTAPAQLRADQTVWDYLTTSNAGDPVEVTLSRYDVATQTAYQSATESWTIAPESLRGAIYYWTTSSGGHLARIQPATGAQPQTVNGGACMGCHAVSADGSTLVASWEGKPVNDGTNDDRAWASFDLPGESLRVLSTYFSGILAVNPNGKYVVFGSQTLKLGDTLTGQVVASGLETLPLDSGMSGFMTPAFSPSGSKLAMIEGAGTWYHNLKTNGQLVITDFDEASAKFSNKQVLIKSAQFKAGQNVLSYPSFSPDSQWIAFDAIDDPDSRSLGELWLAGITGTPLVRLDALTDSSPTASDDNHSLEPTFNPIERGGYFWVVFTSSRAWGNRIAASPSLDQERLWVAAIDTTPASGAADPSHPGFFLEGQEENTKNRRGFWTLAPCIPTGAPTVCGAGFECCSGFCKDAVCVDPKLFPCEGVGSECTTDADCCNAGAVKCEAGKCAAVVPS